MADASGERLRAQLLRQERQIEDLLNVVIPMGVAMVGQRDFNCLMEMILLGAKRVCGADGGTLYLLGDGSLHFAIIVNDTLGIRMGGTSGAKLPFASLPLKDPQTGEPNSHNVATHAALSRRSIRIDDAYQMDRAGYDGPQSFDHRNHYHTRSLLTVPLVGSDDTVIGVLQIINARDPLTGQLGPFGHDQQRMVETLSTLAAAAVEAHAREKRLRIEIHTLHVQIDESRRKRDVQAITGSDYFQDLQHRARQMRESAATTT
jgi:GAF domain-containing protein